MVESIIKNPKVLLLSMALGLASCSDYTASPVEGDGSSALANEKVTISNNKGADGGVEPGNGDPGDGDPGNGDPGNGDPGNGDPGNGDPGDGDPGDGDPGDGDPGNGDPVDGDPADGDATPDVADNTVVRFLAAEKVSLLNDTPFVYIQRSVSGNAKANAERFKASIEDTEKAPLDLSSPYNVNSGAKLIFRSSLDADGVEIDILSGYFQSDDFDVKDINVSPDGKHLIFAAHGPLDHPHDNTWNIYELGFESGLMRRIFREDAIANAGHDTSPTYAVDGRIVFSSDRSAGTDRSCYKIGPNEKPSLLHSMSNAGENVLQLTHGTNHDIKATTMKDGRISFVRWSKVYERADQCADQEPIATTSDDIATVVDEGYPTGLSSPDAWSEDKVCAYTQSSPFGPVIASNHYTLLRISVDGEELDQLYETVSIPASDEGFLSLGKLVQAENGKLLALLKHDYSEFSGGNVLELQTPSSGSTSAVFGNMAPQTLTGKEANLYPSQLSASGWYSAVWPYRDGSSRVLISWSQCLTVTDGVHAFCKGGDDEGGEADVRYGIWVYDPATDSRLPIVRPRQDVVYSELALAQSHIGKKLPYTAFSDEYIENPDLSRVVSTETSRAFPVILRDFLQSHPDFESANSGEDEGIVADTLGDDNKPVYARASGSSPTTSGADYFNQWYNTVEGVNVEVPMAFELTREPDSVLWTYSSSSFFPLDGLGWDAIATPESEVFNYSDSNIHNYHFTLEAHLEFDYKGGEEFSFRGDDDLWVYINGKLAIDIGGVHGPLPKSINLDELAEELGIEVGKRYSFDLFFAERHLVESNFRFQTSINLECVYVSE